MANACSWQGQSHQRVFVVAYAEKGRRQVHHPPLAKKRAPYGHHFAKNYENSLGLVKEFS